MLFINRQIERESFKNTYEQNIQKNVSQVYIIEAEHGVGKTEFIKEVSKYFANYPLEIIQSDSAELSLFKMMVLELDKASVDYGYDDFKNFYDKKFLTDKAISLLLRITAIFGQAWAKKKNFDMEFTSLITSSAQNNKFILNAQIENLFEYAKYVFNSVHMHIIFYKDLVIDSGSINLLSKLISISKGSVFLFESDSCKRSLNIEQSLKNNHNILCKKYKLDKLSDRHLQTYIQQCLSELKLEANRIDSSILMESVEKGDLAEISSILKDYNERIKNDDSIKIRSIKEIIYSLPERQKAIIILIYCANNKLNLIELLDVISELDIGFCTSDLDALINKNLIAKKGDRLFLQSFIYKILNEEGYTSPLKYAVSSALVKNINVKLNQSYNARYIDLLVEYYVNNHQFLQLKSLIPQISQRIKKFDTQEERIDYFKLFCIKRQDLHKKDEDLVIAFTKIAYDTNLYSEALDFIELIEDKDGKIVFAKALILNRCEEFISSKEYINSKLSEFEPNSSIYFKLSLILMMDLIQLNERDNAMKIFEELKSYRQELLFPYLIRLSNVFYENFEERLMIVKSITEDMYAISDDEFSGLHAIYLSYLYSLTKQPQKAEQLLVDARNYFGRNLIYNHMILHNEANIKFHNNEIDEDIPILLNNAKITAYDEYDKFAINNNLLIYYILSDNMSSLECQNVVIELETMLKNTKYKRFIDKINYNMYHYYKKMYNFEKSEYYKTQLLQTNIKCNDTYKYKLMYETSWKLPINI